ncbi:MAG TPA: hypothetical protein VJQ45_11740 [Ktedonobacterales bacterium]|nr:hypothetical protein [Ktedonobacterales bacterium]
MTLDVSFILTVVAVAADGMLAGASLDQSLKQLPARHRIGAVAYAAYTQAADLGPGVLWYGILGVGAAVLTIAAGVTAVVRHVGAPVIVPLVIAGALSIFHSLATTQAAPAMFSQRHVPQTDAALGAVFARFARWQTIRVTLQVLTLAAVVWALVAWFALA